MSSANNFDPPPIYDTMTDKEWGGLSYPWQLWFTFFYQNIIGFLSQNGIYLPRLTATEIAQIPLPVVGKALGDYPNNSGQMLYDITNNVPKILVITLDSDGLVASVNWKTFTIT